MYERTQCIMEDELVHVIRFYGVCRLPNVGDVVLACVRGTVLCMRAGMKTLVLRTVHLTWTPLPKSTDGVN